jgi:hypothetical protein
MVVAVVALVAALGGSGFAASHSAVKHPTHRKHKPPTPSDDPQDSRLIQKKAALLRGPTGPMGAQGGQGVQGPIGPSNAVEVTRTTGLNLTGTADTTVATLSGLTAGAYAIVAHTMVTWPASNPAGATDVTCKLNAEGDNNQSYAYLGSGNNGGDTFDAALPMELSHTFAATGTATVSCSKISATPPVSVGPTTIMATRLGSETHGTVTS